MLGKARRYAVHCNRLEICRFSCDRCQICGPTLKLPLTDYKNCLSVQRSVGWGHNKIGDEIGSVPHPVADPRSRYREGRPGSRAQHKVSIILLSLLLQACSAASPERRFDSECVWHDENIYIQTDDYIFHFSQLLAVHSGFVYYLYIL